MAGQAHEVGDVSAIVAMQDAIWRTEFTRAPRGLDVASAANYWSHLGRTSTVS